MDKYIKVEDFKKAYKQQHAGKPGRAYYLVDEIPEADVQPVVHGKWLIGTNALGEKYFACSECNESWWEDKTYDKYCSNCGAKMHNSF